MRRLAQRPGIGQTYWNAFQFGTWTALLIIVAGALGGGAVPILAALRGKGKDVS